MKGSACWMDKCEFCVATENCHVFNRPGVENVQVKTPVLLTRQKTCQSGGMSQPGMIKEQQGQMEWLWWTGFENTDWEDIGFKAVRGH